MLPATTDWEKSMKYLPLQYGNESAMMTLLAMALILNLTVGRI